MCEWCRGTSFKVVFAEKSNCGCREQCTRPIKKRRDANVVSKLTLIMLVAEPKIFPRSDQVKYNHHLKQKKKQKLYKLTLTH